jgi:hypothetical protein
MAGCSMLELEVGSVMGAEIVLIASSDRSEG